MSFRKVIVVLLMVGVFCCGWLYEAEAYVVTSPFGFRKHPIDGNIKFHNGVDFAFAEGTPVGSLWDGRVVFASSWGGYGNCVVIAHDNDFYTLYGHLSKIDVNTGDVVSAGSLIGLVGSTGYSTGPHLHLSVWQGNKWIDPMSVL